MNKLDKYFNSNGEYVFLIDNEFYSDRFEGFYSVYNARGDRLNYEELKTREVEIFRVCCDFPDIVIKDPLILALNGDIEYIETIINGK